MTFTDWFTAGLVLLALAADVVFRAVGGEPGTISYRLSVWSKKYPLIPFAGGLLAGHFWWGNGGNCP